MSEQLALSGFCFLFVGSSSSLSIFYFEEKPVSFSSTVTKLTEDSTSELLKMSLFPFHRLCFYVVWCPFWYLLGHHQNKASACVPELYGRWFVGHVHSLRQTFGFLGDDKMYILGPSALEGTQGLPNKQGFPVVFPAGVQTTLFTVQFIDLLGDYLMLDFFLPYMWLLPDDSLSHLSEILLLLQVHYEPLYMETTRIFWLAKLHWRKYVEITWVFRPAKLRQKSTWKRHQFFEQRSSIEKVCGHDVEFLRNLVFVVLT